MADEAKTPDPATAAAPPAGAPQPPPSDSPPAAAAADAPPADAPAADAAAAAPTLLQKFDAEAKGEAAPAEGDKPADGEKPADKPADGEKLADKAAEEKPADKPAEGDKAEAKPDEKKADAKPEDKAAEPAKLEPVAYEYQLPETIQLDDARKGEFHAVLDGFRADPVKGAQALIDLHNKTMTEYAQKVADDQRKTWNDTRKEWQTEALADEQIGGAGYQTAMTAVARMRDLFVPEGERKAFDQFLEITGAGDHPQFLKMLHRAARYFDEPRMPPSNIKPPADNGRNPNSRRGLLYDHPRSNQNRQQ